ncbi:MAG: (2Fe-2S)-binding protein [Proteobacteria bacterium]|nr:(2Fe-2S)-binding protein [Pseudomonadota bacterium]
MTQTAPNPEELGAPVKLTINGQAVEAREGMTILQAAREVGIEIPTLCYLEELSGYGSCRMCLVEILKGRRSRTVVSCLYPVEEGLEVQTESEKIAHHRKLILELLAARWDRVDPALIKKYGADPERFEKHTTYCILCGLCVRHCAEVEGRNVLGFIGRGTERQVVVYPELAVQNCPECAKGGEMPCLAVCPTGVITSEFAAAGLTLPDKLPVAYPVCIKDDDNVRDVAKKVGDV